MRNFVQGARLQNINAAKVCGRLVHIIHTGNPCVCYVLCR